MPPPPQDEPGKLASRPAPRPNQGVEKAGQAGVKVAKAATRPTDGTSVQRQVTKPINRPSQKSVTGSSTKPGSATLSSQTRPNVPKDNDRGLDTTLRTELEEKYPKDNWFDGHGSLDKMSKTKHKIKNGEEIWLSNLQVPIFEKKAVRYIGLREAIQEHILLLLEIEAKWNPVTRINRQPQDCPRPLWNGQLFLGGIKDSGNVKPLFLSEVEKYDISAVVSIHPDDWLAQKIWKEKFVRWDSRFPPPERTNGKAVQYHIDLPDDPSSNLLGKFEKAFKFIDYYLSRGKNVLVHCKMGQSRSASLVLGYTAEKYCEQLPPEVKKSTNLNETLSNFTTDLMKKRKGIKPGNFRNQVLEHLTQVVKGDMNQPSQQPKPAVQPQKKGGGGIVKDAALISFYVHNWKPTREILGYWLSRKDANQHYWIAAMKAKAIRKGNDVKDNLSFNEFFEQELRARQRMTQSA